MKYGPFIMATYNSQMFYLGNFTDMDTNEAIISNENPKAILGTYASPNLVNVTVQDSNNDNRLDDDELGTTPGEDISYDVGSGPTTQFLDSTSVYVVSVLLADGSTTNIFATAIQTQNGDVFLTDPWNGGSFDNLNVQSFQITRLNNSGYTNFIADSSVDNTAVVCFVGGTKIRTPSGGVAVEHLRAGDQIVTLDHGPVRLRGVFSKPIGRIAKNQPVSITQGALGNGYPRRDLLLSPQHRVMVSSMVAQRMFGQREVLICAKALIGVAGITQRPAPRDQSYYHLICDRHEIVFAFGYPAETFYPGDQAMSTLSTTGAGRQAAASTLHDQRALHQPARFVPEMAQQRKLVQRISKNAQPYWHHHRRSAAPRQTSLLNESLLLSIPPSRAALPRH